MHKTERGCYSKKKKVVTTFSKKGEADGSKVYDVVLL